MRILLALIVVLAASGVCVAQSNKPGLRPSQRRDLARVIAYLDQVTDHARYSFECSIVRATAHPTQKIVLRDGCEHMWPFLRGEVAGPLITCRGGVNGPAWFVDVVDRQMDREGVRTRSYFDGSWTAQFQLADKRQRVRVYDRYWDPSVGVAPWLMHLAGTTPFAQWMHAALDRDQLSMQSRTPTKPADAGPYELYSIRFRGQQGAEHELHVKLGPKLVQVQRIKLFRGDRKISELEILKHEKVGEIYLPTAFRDFSASMIEDRVTTPDAAIILDWEIGYGTRHTDPAGFLNGLRHARSVCYQRTEYPYVWVDGRIKQFVRSRLKPDGLDVADGLDLAAVNLAECKWPSIRDWHTSILKPGYMEGRIGEWRISKNAAIVTCAQLNKCDLSLVALMAKSPPKEPSPAQMLEALLQCKLSYVQVQLREDQLRNLRDPFILITPMADDTPYAEAGVTTAGECVVWSPAFRRRVVNPRHVGPRRTVLISASDSKRAEK